jgi:hypothetical protein
MSVSPSSETALRADLSRFPERLRYRPLELCISCLYGVDDRAPRVPKRVGLTPRGAFEAAILSSLQRPPCLVAFSGGRDSSAVLAVATNLARIHGLPLPIPVTNRFPGFPEADESAWQELVVGHLGLSEWLRREWTDELDLVGPYAQRVLMRHGLMFPFNRHFLEPSAELATGGSILSGLGGDEVLGPMTRPIASALVYERRLPRRSQLRQLAKEVAPLPVRARIRARRVVEFAPWIRPAPRRRLAVDMGRSNMAQSIRWDRATREGWRSRYIQGVLASAHAVAAAHDARFAAPFFDATVLAAYADRQGPRSGPPRSQALEELVGDLLPRAVTSRASKASFGGAFWGRHTQEFVSEWDGRGVDEDLVEPEILAAEWRSARPQATSQALLQAVWLSRAVARAPSEVIAQ